MKFPRIIKLITIFIVFCGIYGEDLPFGCVDTRTHTGSLEPSIIQVNRQGNLYSPGFLQNKNYPDNVRCSYQLQASAGMHFRIRFNLLDIEATDSCEADNLVVYDFNSEGVGNGIAVLCGNQTPHDYVSSTNIMQLAFRSDAFAGGKGYSITYLPQDSARVCLIGQKQCRNRKCVEYSVVCDGNDDCGDGTDEEKCPGVVLPTVECGRPAIDHVDFADFDRVVGGQEAVKGSWPWMVALQMKLIEPSGQICGGSLINAQWVLTAAHCFGDLREPSDWRITIGDHDKFLKESEEQVRYAERIVIYDDIRPAQFEYDGEFDIVNDVALVKLNAPVKFNNFVKPVCLPDPRHKLSIISNCYATGWGQTRGTGSNNALKQAYHPVQQDIMCQRLVGGEFHPGTMICAGSMGPLNGVCHGDSGGPLVCETEKGKWSIVGVASFVTEGNGDGGICGIKGRPSVFNKIAVKNGWIRRMINRYS